MEESSHQKVGTIRKLYNMFPLKISGWKTTYIPFEMPSF